MLHVPGSRAPMISAVTPAVTPNITPQATSLSTERITPPHSRQPLSSASSVATSSRVEPAFRKTGALVQSPTLEPVGSADSDVGMLLVKHACITAALASRLPEEADIGPEGIRRSMDAYVRAARRRVAELSDLAPVHAMSALTQLFIFEGMRHRDAEETALTRRHRAEIDGLTDRISALDSELKQKASEVQLLREAVLEVQTNANKQVMDARSLQTACEREIARQAAELTKVTQYCDHLKQQLEAVESKNARQYLDNSPAAVGGSAGAAMMLRRATQAAPNMGSEVPQPQPDARRAALPHRDAVASPTLLRTNSNGIGRTASESSEASREAGTSSGTSPLKKRDSVRGSMRSIRVGFTEDVAASPDSADLEDPVTASPTFAAPGSVTFSSRGVPSVPTEAYVEGVYLQMGGAKDRSTTVPQSSVLRHLERTYDDLGDPHRFARLVGKKNRFSFDELAMVLLQVARL